MATRQLEQLEQLEQPHVASKDLDFMNNNKMNNNKMKNNKMRFISERIRKRSRTVLRAHMLLCHFNFGIQNHS